MATRSVRARFADGKLEPLEPLDLDEGCEVTVTVEEPIEEAPREEEEPIEGEGGGAAVLSIIRRLHAKYPNMSGDGPHDMAQYYKHYLYGHPREDFD